MTSSGSFPSKARHCDTANSQLPGLMASDLKAVIILKLEDNKFSIKYTLSFLPVFSAIFMTLFLGSFRWNFLIVKPGVKTFHWIRDYSSEGSLRETNNDIASFFFFLPKVHLFVAYWKDNILDHEDVWRRMTWDDIKENLYIKTVKIP